MVCEDGYWYLHETHFEGYFKWVGKNAEEQGLTASPDEVLVANQIREFILTQIDIRGRNVLHIACMNGDKHYVTMILYEAEFIDPKLTELLIEMEDYDKLTPLYLLCEQGFRRKDFKMDHDWQIRNFLN